MLNRRNAIKLMTSGCALTLFDSHVKGNTAKFPPLTVSTLEEWDRKWFDRDKQTKQVVALLENQKLWNDLISELQKNKSIYKHFIPMARMTYDVNDFIGHRIVNIGTMIGPSVILSDIFENAPSKTILAGTKRLKAILTSVSHNYIADDDPAKSELLAVLSQEIRLEQAREIIWDLMENCGSAMFRDYKNPDQASNVLKQMMVKIKTKTGVYPNWIMGCKNVLDFLAKHLPSRNVRPNAYQSLDPKVEYIIRIGDVDVLAISDYLLPVDEVLFGYKGTKAHPSPYYHCPYVAFSATPWVLEPITNKHRIGFLTRFSKHLVEGGSAYYGRVGLKGIEQASTI